MARERARSPPRGDHHGRQRPVGRAARAAALGRTPHGRRGGPPHGARGHGAGRPVPDHLQLLLGELGAAGERDRRSDGADAPLHPARSGRAAPERRAHQRDRRARPGRCGAAGPHRRGGRAHLRQRRAQPADRLQLRLAGRDRQGRAAAGRARAGGDDQAAGHHARGAVGCARYARSCPTPICSSAPAASCGCRISCCGSRPIPSSCSSMRSGPTSVASCWSRPSTSSVGATVGSAAWRPDRPFDGRQSTEAKGPHERRPRGERRRRRIGRCARAPRRRFRAEAGLGRRHGRGRGSVHVLRGDAVRRAGRGRHGAPELGMGTPGARPRSRPRHRRTRRGGRRGRGAGGGRLRGAGTAGPADRGHPGHAAEPGAATACSRRWVSSMPVCPPSPSSGCAPTPTSGCSPSLS